MKLIIGSIVIFFVVIMFLFALFPADISVSRMLEIHGTKEQINKKITDLREWKNWNELLTNAIILDKKTNQPVSIDSSQIDLGTIKIDLIKPASDTLVTKWQRGDRHFTGNFISTQMNGFTVLQWTLNFHIKWYPWDKLSSMFYEKQLGPAMEKSLVNLQKEIEIPAN